MVRLKRRDGEWRAMVFGRIFERGREMNRGALTAI